MPETYTFYIDESGDSGTGQVRSGNEGGASPYMTLGGVLLLDKDESALQQFLVDEASELGVNTLHCSDMNHRKKVHYARGAAMLPITCFGVISFKQTLEEYREDIGDEYWRYYHKCAQYLLERLGRFLQEHNIPKEAVRIVFEASNHIRLPQLRRFITACQNNPVRQQTAFLSRIHTNNISIELKENTPLLCFGDLTAHALYQCVNKALHNYGIPETRYTNEMASRFYSSPRTSKILNWGIMPIHRISDLQLDKDVHTFLQNLST